MEELVLNHLRQVLNDPRVREELTEWAEAAMKPLRSQLENSTDPTSIYRLQGQIMSFRRLQRIKEELENGK